MEKLRQASQFIKRETLARVAGSALVGMTGSGHAPDDYSLAARSSVPIVRTLEEMQLPVKAQSLYDTQEQTTEDRFVSFPQSKNTDDVFREEFANIDSIRSEFDSINNVDTKGKLLSFDPVKSRNRYEQCKTPQERWEWRRNEWKEITSTLRERYNCVESPMDFFIDTDGKLRNREFSTDTLETILERGVAYQEKNGSKELERERSEVVGMKKLQAYFLDPETEIGSVMVVLSPPGMVEGSNYTKRFADRYLLLEDPVTGKRIIEGKRFSTEMSYEEYRSVALALNPSYFDNEEGPLDAFLLRNPIKLEGKENSDEMLEDLLQLDPTALRGDEFRIANLICEPFKRSLLEAITHWNPKLVAYSLNTLLHLGDEAERLLQSGDLEGLRAMFRWSRSLSGEEVEAHVEKRGGVPPAVRAVGCGDSTGFGSFENSVGQFGIDPKKDPNLCQKCVSDSSPHFHCGGEKMEIVKDKEGKPVLDDVGREKKEKMTCEFKVIVGKGITRCPDCGKGKVC